MTTLDELLARGDLARAKQEAEKILAQDPSDRVALVALAKVFLVSNQLERAEQLIAQLQSLGPAAQTFLLEANLQGQRGQLAEAERSYRSAIQLQPDLAEAHFGLGMMVAKHGKMADAVEPLTRAADAAPHNAVFQYRLGQVLLDVGRNDEAVPRLEAAIGREPKFVPAYLALGQLLAMRGGLVQSRQLLEKGLKAVPNQPRLMAALTNVTILQGDLRTAQKVATKLANARPDDADAQGNLAQIYLLINKRGDALAICQRMSSLGKATAPLKMAEATYWEGEEPPNFEKAIAAYEEAMAIDPDGWRAANNLGQLLLRMKTLPPDKNVPRAVTVLEEAHRRKPDQLEPMLNLALAYVRAGENGRGLELARKLTDYQLPEGHTIRDQAERLVKALAQ